MGARGLDVPAAMMDVALALWPLGLEIWLPSAHRALSGVGKRALQMVDAPELFAQDLLDPRDRLVDRLLQADAFFGDAVGRLRQSNARQTRS